MSDLIERRAAIDAVNVGNLHPGIIGALKDIIEEIPSAEPEIIRCKDCKWCVEHYDRDGDPYWICKNWDGGTDADGFCYEAERKNMETSRIMKSAAQPHQNQ